jgi:SAM-dependent methyltransferase
LSIYINRELNRYHKDEIQLAYYELKKVKSGKDPDYSYPLIEYVYLLEYFLDNTYCSYLAWFLIYRSGKLKSNLKILDVAAGHGTMLYGLAGLIERLHKNGLQTPMHINYHALEQQNLFLKIGLEFWQEYIVDNHPSSNTFWRLDSSNLFDYYKQKTDDLPVQFFDFIVICHCFFWNADSRASSTQIYTDIFKKHLAKDGYIVLIIQESKLFSLFDTKQRTKEMELEIIQDFVQSFSLQLVWYKRVDSTPQREKMNVNLNKFATENLPPQSYLSPIKKKLFNLKFDSNYILDDYIILAQI